MQVVKMPFTLLNFCVIIMFCFGGRMNYQLFVCVKCGYKMDHREAITIPGDSDVYCLSCFNRLFRYER